VTLVQQAALPASGASWADWRPRDLAPVRQALLVAAILVAVACVVLLVRALWSILVLLLVASTLAYILEPLVRRAERRGVKRFWSALIIGVTVLALELLLIGWLVPQLAREGLGLARALPHAVTQLLERWELAPYVNRLTASQGGVTAWIGDQGERMVLIARGAAGKTATVAALVALFPLLVGLVVAHMRGALRLYNYVPRDKRGEVRRIIDSMDQAVGSFFRGRVIICSIVAVLLGVGWQICGVPQALALGLLGGVLNLVPFANALAWLLAVVLSFTAEGQSSWTSLVVWLTVVFVVVQLLENNVLTPWIQSNAVNLSALTVVLSTLIGGSLLGALGLFYAIPVTACLKKLLEDVFLPRLRAWAEAR
jgi:predicted PurR-regulated permease PerM